VAQPRAAGAAAAGGGSRPAARAAMEAAAPVGHGRLAATAAGPRARAAARHRGEVTAGVAVAQTAAAGCSGGHGGRGGGGGRERGAGVVLRIAAAATAAAAAAARARRVLVLIRAPAQPDDGLAQPLLAPQLVQRHHADAVAFHQPGDDAGEPRRLEAGAVVARVVGVQHVDHSVDPRRQPHHQPMADRKLMPKQRRERIRDRGPLRRGVGELAGTGGRRKRQSAMRRLRERIVVHVRFLLPVSTYAYYHKNCVSTRQGLRATISSHQALNPHRRQGERGSCILAGASLEIGAVAVCAVRRGDSECGTGRTLRMHLRTPARGASPPGSSPSTTTRKASSFATPTSSTPTIPTRA
jgi:hypothetical protein